MGLLDLLRRKPAQKTARGGSGRAHTNGFLQYEEANVELVGPAGLRVFDQMYRTDPDVRRVLRMAVNPIIGGTWSIDPYGADEAEARDREVAEFVEWAVFRRMRPRWRGFLGQALPVLGRSGFAPFEVIWETDTWKGRQVLVPKRLDLRLPRTIVRFNQEDGELVSLTQQLLIGSPDGDPEVDLPIEDVLYLRVGAEGDNWEGESLLRACYKPWFLKERIEKIDAIGIEREAVGVPIAYPPNTNVSAETLTAVEEVLKGLRANEQGYIVAPGPHQQFAPEGQGWLFEILAHKQSEGRSTEPSLKYHSDKIAAAFVAEFMRLGQAGEGARATADVQQDPFLAAVEAFAGVGIEDPFNEQLVARLVALNFDVEEPPTLTMSLVDSTTLGELKDYVAGLAEKGALHPDAPLEDFLRERADLPPADPEERQRRQEIERHEEETAAVQRDAQAVAAKAQAENPEAVPPDDGPPQQLAREDRPLRTWETYMSLDRIESSIDQARESFEIAGGEATRALAKDLAVAAGKGRNPAFKPPAELVDALRGELVALYRTGRETVAEELRRQAIDARFELADDLENPELPGSLLRRARLAAQAIVTATWRRVSTLALIPGRNTAAELQFEAERAAMFALRQEATEHAAPALNAGRLDEATARAEEIEGSRYTAILDGRACSPCTLADDDVLRPLDDPVRLARIPPNPSCEGGSRCRCMEAFELTTETPPTLDRVPDKPTAKPEPDEQAIALARLTDSLTTLGQLMGASYEQLAEAVKVAADKDPAKIELTVEAPAAPPPPEPQAPPELVINLPEPKPAEPPEPAQIRKTIVADPDSGRPTHVEERNLSTGVVTRRTVQYDDEGRIVGLD